MNVKPATWRDEKRFFGDVRKAAHPVRYTLECLRGWAYRVSHPSRYYAFAIVDTAFAVWGHK